MDLDTLQMGEAIWNASRTSMFAPVWQMRQQGLVRRPVVLQIITDRSSMSLPHLLPEAPRGARYFPGDGTPTAPTAGPGVRPSAPVTVDLIINDAECQAALHRLDMWVWGQVMQTLSTPPPDPNDAVGGAAFGHAWTHGLFFLLWPCKGHSRQPFYSCTKKQKKIRRMS